MVTVSRRLGHTSPTIALSIYAHLFDKTDEGAAQAIEAILNEGQGDLKSSGANLRSEGTSEKLWETPSPPRGRTEKLVFSGS